VSHGGIRNPLHQSKEWMSETLLPTTARASALGFSSHHSRTIQHLVFLRYNFLSPFTSVKDTCRGILPDKARKKSTETRFRVW